MPHDSTKFIDVMENTSDCLDDIMMEETVTVCADKGCDDTLHQKLLQMQGTGCCIPYKKNSKFIMPKSQNSIYNKTRSVVERFFGRLKNGFHRTGIRYEKNCENYLGFVSIASFLMYCRVLR